MQAYFLVLPAAESGPDHFSEEEWCKVSAFVGPAKLDLVHEQHDF
jgi:hypothetical protein